MLVRRKDICKMAKEYWMSAKDLSDSLSSFILRDGKVLEMSKNGEGYSHAAVGMAWDSHNARCDDDDTYFDDMDMFMNVCGAMRFTQMDMHRQMVIETTLKPTEKQILTLVKDIREKKPESLDLYDDEGDGTYCEYISKNPRPLDIQRWISKCW